MESNSCKSDSFLCAKNKLKKVVYIFLKHVLHSPWTKIPCISSFFQTRQFPRFSALGAISAVGAAFAYSKKNSSPLLPNLEAIYSDQCFKKLNTTGEHYWDMFLEPNECGVQNVAEHLKTGKGGVILSTGTERSFFDLLLRSQLEPKMSMGLMIVDINPKAIAYANMVILLLRIAKDVQDFSVLSGPNRGNKHGISQMFLFLSLRKPLPFLTDQEIVDKTTMIRERVLASDIPQTAKEFYLNGLDDFAKVYFQSSNEWRLSGNDAVIEEYWRENVKPLEETWKSSGIDVGQPVYKIASKAFENVQYHKEKKQFEILQRFARAGSIVALCEDLPRLQFLHKKQEVAVIDLSNIDEYCPIDLPCPSPKFSPRVIWTCCNFPSATYRSYTHHPKEESLAEKEKKEFDLLIHELQSISVVPRSKPNLFFRPEDPRDLMKIPEQRRPFGYYPSNLDILRTYKKKWVAELPHVGFVSFGPRVSDMGQQVDRMDISWIRATQVSKLLEIAKSVEIQRFVLVLVSLWKEDLGEKYFVFSNVPGWREAFILEKEKNRENPLWKSWVKKNQDMISHLSLNPL